MYTFRFVAMVGLALVAAWAGCSSSKSTSGDSDETQQRTKPVGVDPMLFKCEMVATVAELESLLGGKLKQAEGQFEPPEGTPRSCNYLRAEGESQQAWSFDMDCRADAIKTAGTLMEQYKAGAASRDAGTAEVEVGQTALDHHGQALIFIDDDTPCYVRVQGPIAEGRLALGQHLAKKLSLETAPMRSLYRKRVE